MRSYIGGGEGPPGMEFDWDHYIPSFEIEEIFSPDCLRGPMLLHLIDLDAVLKLQRFRDRVYGIARAGLLVNFGGFRRRGVRTIPEQIAIWESQGSSGRSSHHVGGRAFDITMTRGHDTDWLVERALEFGWTGVGMYKTFVHVDSRNNFDGKATTWDRR